MSLRHYLICLCNWKKTICCCVGVSLSILQNDPDEYDPDSYDPEANLSPVERLEKYMENEHSYSRYPNDFMFC